MFFVRKIQPVFVPMEITTSIDQEGNVSFSIVTSTGRGLDNMVDGYF